MPGGRIAKPMNSTASGGSVAVYGVPPARKAMAPTPRVRLRPSAEEVVADFTVSVQEACVKLGGIGVTKFNELVKVGEIEVAYIGRRKVVPLRSLTDYLARLIEESRSGGVVLYTAHGG